MKTIELTGDAPRKKITFERIKPFKNICKVTGVQEFCNAVVEYIPRKKVVDIVDYRRWFEGGVLSICLLKKSPMLCLTR